jgi:OOP family OmpA-OmpF porin
MLKKYSYFLIALAMHFTVNAQSTPAAPLNLPKDAQVNVSIKDARTKKMLSSEIVVFKSLSNGTEFQGLSDSLGKFSLRLPAGSKYEVFVLGFKDSTSNSFLDIPALKNATSHYTVPFEDDIEFEPPASFVLDNCTFQTGKAILEKDAFKVLDELVEYLKRKDDEKIEIGGHTDNVGKVDANMLLSTNRANTVRAYLLTQGIAPERVTSKGYGMSMPIAENTSAEGRALNRRTEVKIIE